MENDSIYVLARSRVGFEEDAAEGRGGQQQQFIVQKINKQKSQHIKPPVQK